MASIGRSQVLAVITARGGSKGLPQKNLRPLADKPLIAHTIDAAKHARFLDRTIVSTDDEQIAALARSHGADVPFLRPAELARDETPSLPVLIHAIRWLDGNEAYRPDYVMLLQPTSPLRTAQDIDNCITLALEKDADGVVSLCQAKHHPYWMKRVEADGRVTDLLLLDQPLETAYSRRQDLPPGYAINGAVYLVRREILLEYQTFYTDRTYAYVMPLERSLDIDTLWDFRLAEFVLKDDVVQQRA